LGGTVLPIILDSKNEKGKEIPVGGKYIEDSEEEKSYDNYSEE
jgi:hypothetical protein